MCLATFVAWPQFPYLQNASRSIKGYFREQKECHFLPCTLLVFVCDLIREIKLNMQIS